MTKWLKILITVSLLVTVSGLGACDGDESEIYENPDYRYSMYYPTGWQIDDERPDIVHFFHSNIDRHVPATIAVMVIKREDKHFNEWIESFTQEYVNEKKEGTVLQSDRPESKWSWKLDYWYVWKGVDFQCEAYFFETVDFMYTVLWEAPVEEIEVCNTCQRSVSTFTTY